MLPRRQGQMRRHVSPKETVCFMLLARFDKSRVVYSLAEMSCLAPFDPSRLALLGGHEMKVRSRSRAGREVSTQTRKYRRWRGLGRSDEVSLQAIRLGRILEFMSGDQKTWGGAVQGLLAATSKMAAGRLGSQPVTDSRSL